MTSIIRAAQTTISNVFLFGNSPNKSLFLFFVFIISAFAPQAQSLIKGRVVDAKSRQPLEGATIAATGENGVNSTSGVSGSFSIRVPAKTTALQVSFIGYKTMAYDISGKENFTAELSPDVVNLKDITLVQGTSQQRFNSLAKIDLDLRPVKTTQELMRIVPGLFVAQHAGGGKAEQIFLRGFDCDHGTDIAVSVDGMPVNMVSHAHGQGYADAHFIIPETVNNIDYGAGPYYTGQGNLNTAGYVSFSTFKNIANSQVQVEAGRYNTYRVLTLLDLLKKNKDRESAYLASEYNYTNGPTLSPQKFNRLNIFGKYNRTLSTNTRLTVSLSGFDSKWYASGQVPDRAVKDGTIDRFGSIDPTEGGNTGRYNANLSLVHEFKNGYTWSNQAYYTRNIFNLYSNFTFFANDPVNGDEINQAEKRNILGVASNISRQKFYDGSTLNSVYGVGLRYDQTANSLLANVVQRRFLRYTKLGDINEANFFAYAQKQITRGKFLADAGLRFDYLHFDYFDKLATAQLPARGKSIVSPKLNIQYTANPTLQLYIKLGKGFHSNDTRVVTANNGNQILPAAYGADAGIIVKPISKLFINMAAYYLYLQQEFVYVGDDGNIEPSGKTRRYGLDVMLRYQFTKNIFANTNINLSNGRAIGEPKEADNIPLAPRFTSTGGIYFKKKPGFNGGLNYRFIKDRPANEDNSIVARGYFILDGSLNYTKSSYEIGIAFENLLNIDWNEAQFATESRLVNEPAPVNELNYTPGTPFFFRVKLAVFF